MFSNTSKCDIQSLSIKTLFVSKVNVFRALYLKTVILLTLHSYINVTYQFVCYTVLCDKVSPRSPTNKVREDVTESVQMCV